MALILSIDSVSKTVGGLTSFSMLYVVKSEHTMVQYMSLYHIILHAIYKYLLQASPSTIY